MNIARTTNADFTNKNLTIVCGNHEQILNHYSHKFVKTLLESKTFVAVSKTVMLLA